MQGTLNPIGLIKNVNWLQFCFIYLIKHSASKVELLLLDFFLPNTNFTSWSAYERWKKCTMELNYSSISTWEVRMHFSQLTWSSWSSEIKSRSIKQDKKRKHGNWILSGLATCVSDDKISRGKWNTQIKLSTSLKWTKNEIVRKIFVFCPQNAWETIKLEKNALSFAPVSFFVTATKFISYTSF